MTPLPVHPLKPKDRHLAVSEQLGDAVRIDPKLFWRTGMAFAKMNDRLRTAQRENENLRRHAEVLAQVLVLGGAPKNHSYIKRAYDAFRADFPSP